VWEQAIRGMVIWKWQNGGGSRARLFLREFGGRKDFEPGCWAKSFIKHIVKGGAKNRKKRNVRFEKGRSAELTLAKLGK